MLDQNIKPYYNDYDVNKNYHRIMFAPGRPVQARELTQLQSILQEQVKRLGDFVLDNGSMVIPGHVFFDSNVHYVSLESTYGGNLADEVVESYVGKTLSGGTSKVKAYCIAVTKSSGTKPATLFVKYTASGEAASEELENPKKFTKEVIVAEGITEPVKTLGADGGIGSVCHVKEGIYYVNGYFVQVSDQSIVVSFDSKPTCRVGLRVDEFFVGPEDDVTLYDNSRGFINRSAPGADRYQIVLTLSSRGLFSEDIGETENNIKFIDLLHLKNGTIQYKVEFAKMGEMEKTLARRTYDESGDYIVEPFNFSFKDYRSNRRGAWVANRYYLEGDVVYRGTNTTDLYTCLVTGVSGSALETLSDVTDAVVSDGVLQWAYTPNPIYNNGEYTSSNDPTTMKADEEKAVLQFNTGVAYIKGFEVRSSGGATIPFAKARTYVDSNNTTLITEIGSYVEVTNVKGMADFNQIQVGVLYDGQADTTPARIGTCKIRGLELLTQGATRAEDIYKLYVFDVVIDDPKTRNFNETFQITITTGSGVQFFCEIQPTLIPMVGTVGVSAGTISGVGTNFSTLKGSSIVRIGTSLSTAKRFYIGAINADFKSSSCTPNTVTVADGASIWLERAVIKGDPILLRTLPHPYIRTLRYTGQNDTSYLVRRIYTWQAAGTPVDVEFNLTTSGEEFAAVGGTNYALAKANTTWTSSFTPVVSNNLTKLTISAGSQEAGQTYYVMATILKKNRSAIEKTKTLKRKVVTIDTLKAVSATNISVGEADVIRIHSIVQSGGSKFNVTTPDDVVAFAYSGSVDITNQFILDGGQKDAFYALGSLKLKPGNKVPVAPIRVTFEYFEHSQGDYFSVDSYSTIPYQNIPSYKGQSLADVLDFRPRIADSGIGFTGTGSSKSEFISPTSYLSCDYSYYLGRQDLIVCTTAGDVKVIEGTPSINPSLPKSNPISEVVLGQTIVNPYTANAKLDVQFLPKRIPRYTMQDIARLEKRLENVEEYVALTLEEKATSEMNITDKYGNDRYKNGFVVDGFKDHGSGFSTHPDYSCSVDPTNRIMRPYADVDSIPFIEETTSNRASQHYVVTGDMVTLPYTKVKVIEQIVASRPEYINPYATFSFFGKFDVFPQQDFWIDTKKEPDVIVRREGNFGTMQTLAQRAGVLGTVWGSWTDIGRRAVGTSSSTSSSNVDFWNGGWMWNTTWRGDWRPSWNTLTTTTRSTFRIDEISMQRQGTETFMAESWDEQSRTTNVLSSSILPYARERSLICHITGMKPSTNVYFWANQSKALVSTPATVIEITTTGKFIGAMDTTTVTDYEAARTGPGKHLYDRGEVITTLTGIKSAVVIEQEKVVVNNVTKTYLYVINVIGGTFSTGDVIQGLGSKATGTVVTSFAGSAKTNINGSYFGTVQIPAKTFTTGTIDLEVNDASSYDPAAIFTSGETTYTSQGQLNVVQDTVVSVRNGQLSTRSVSQNTSRQVSVLTGQTSSTAITSTRYYDPLAETFVIQDEGGTFLTDVDIFFYNVESQYPVTVEIREAVNGYPGPTVLPFGRKQIPGTSCVSSATTLVPTKFTFNSPVYLKAGTEYCMVVLSDSNKTRIWTSRMGEKDITTQKIIDKQPYLGSMFKSQNNSTWTAEQTDDITFVLYKAKFDISKTGELVMVNKSLPTKSLNQNPFSITSGSTKCIVEHFNHGLRVGDRVTYSGIISETGIITGYNLNAMNRQFIVADVSHDGYSITLPGAGAVTGRFGGVLVEATENKEVNGIQIQANELVLPDTSLNYFYRGWANDWQVTDQWRTSSIPLKLNENTDINRIMHVLSSENEKIFSNNRKTLMWRAQIHSTNANVSPVIDLQGAHAIVTTNILDKPTTSLNLDGLNESVILVAGTPVTFTADGFYSETVAVMNELMKVEIGKIHTIDSSLAINDKSFMVTNVTSQYADDTGELNRITVVTNTSFDVTGGQTVTLTKKNTYIDEIAPIGSSSNFKYISSPMKLNDPATGLKLRFAYNKPAGSDIRVYYKTCLSLNDSSLLDNPWVEYIPTTETSFINSANSELYTDFECDIDELAEFDQCLVKIVGQSDVGYKYPKFKSFRLIAVA